MINFYKLEYQMRKHIGYSRDEIYDMYPFERDMLMLIYNEEQKKQEASDKKYYDEINKDIK